MSDAVKHHFRFLGLKCRDRITGFEGVGASVCFDVFGCIQTCLTGPAPKDNGEMKPNSHWFDNNRIEVIDPQLVQPIHTVLTALWTMTDPPGGFNRPAR